MTSFPENSELHEHAVATFFFDKDGILHSVSKPGPRSIELMQSYVACVKKISNNKKVYILSDISMATPMDKATRDYTNSELLNMFCGMAMISTKPLGRMIGNLLLALNAPSLPVKIFSNEKEGMAWLKEIKNEN